MMEENLRRALLLSRGDWSVLVTRPLSAGLLAAARCWWSSWRCPR
jgi:putative tricarboxylic transport membrane protein